jgi:hypothetical protein
VYRSSPCIASLAVSLAKAQAELINPEKSLVATVRSDHDPLPRRMRQNGSQIDQAGGLVDGRCLHGRNLVLAQGLSHNVETAR